MADETEESPEHADLAELQRETAELEKVEEELQAELGGEEPASAAG